MTAPLVALLAIAILVSALPVQAQTLDRVSPGSHEVFTTQDEADFGIRLAEGERRQSERPYRSRNQRVADGY